MSKTPQDARRARRRSTQWTVRMITKIAASALASILAVNLAWAALAPPTRPRAPRGR